MYRFLIRPKWLLAHLLFVLMIIVMINLGFWQLRRLHEKQDFNRNVRAKSELTAAPWADLLAVGADTAALEYRTVEVIGTYVADRQYERSVIRDDQHGFDVINALALADGTAVVVDRGWMPAGAPLPAPPAGEVRLTGRLRESADHGTGQTSAPGTNPAEIFRIDTTTIAEETGLAPAPMYIDLLTSAPADAPLLETVPFPDLGEGPHLGYAVQWFLFSVATLAGWALAIARKVGELRNPDRVDDIGDTAQVG